MPDSSKHRRLSPMRGLSFSFVMALALLLVSLSACGIKPGSVEPPENAATNFPRTYPAPATLDRP